MSDRSRFWYSTSFFSADLTLVISMIGGSYMGLIPFWMVAIVGIGGAAIVILDRRGIVA